jgi:hypothetical protein
VVTFAIVIKLIGAVDIFALIGFVTRASDWEALSVVEVGERQVDSGVADVKEQLEYSVPATSSVFVTHCSKVVAAVKAGLQSAVDGDERQVGSGVTDVKKQLEYSVPATSSVFVKHCSKVVVAVSSGLQSVVVEM